MDATTQSVSDRLDTLERRCSRLRLWCALLATVALTACLSSALRPSPDVIEARGFVVVGPDGAVRAKLDSNDQTMWTGLTIHGAKENQLAILGVYDEREGRDSGAVVHLETGDKDVEVFTALTGKDRAGYLVTDDHQSIQTWIKPGRSGIHFARMNISETQTASDQGIREEEGPEDSPLLRLDLVGDKATIEGLAPTGEVLFHHP